MVYIIFHVCIYPKIDHDYLVSSWAQAMPLLWSYNLCTTRVLLSVNLDGPVKPERLFPGFLIEVCFYFRHKFFLNLLIFQFLKKYSILKFNLLSLAVQSIDGWSSMLRFQWNLLILPATCFNIIYISTRYNIFETEHQYDSVMTTDWYSWWQKKMTMWI